MLTRGGKMWMWAGLGLVLVASQLAVGAVITSGDFSIGYGFTQHEYWNTFETASVNTPTVQGEFTFSPTITGSGFSGGGPYFPNRVLTDNGVNGFVGDTYHWNLTVDGSYNGTPLSGGKVTLNITQISIYGSPWTSDPNTIWFNETTVGHTASSTPVATLPYQGHTNPASYAHLVWDPADFQVSGESSTRTFTIGSSTESAIDGFEIYGNIQYESVPEPLTLALVGLGAGVGIIRRR